MMSLININIEAVKKSLLVSNFWQVMRSLIQQKEAEVKI
jgi:hypothetical protein